jgi:hypothetical protein
MQAILELPESVFRELEVLARNEEMTTADLIQRIVEAHVASRQVNGGSASTVPLPLIPASETGEIRPVLGKDVDELLSRDHFSS